MTVTPITCDNCGAKYKLPESFTGSQAKCQKCGSVIDVQKQRGPSQSAVTPASPAAKPAAARPAAAAKPAVDRSKETTKAERPARPARADKAAKGDDGGGEDRKGRRGEREKPAKKNNNTPLLLGGVGLLAIVVVVVIFMMKKEPPKQDSTAEKPTVEKPADKPAEKPADKPAEKPADKPAEVPADKPAEKPADKPADKPAEPPATKPTDASATPDAPAAASDGPWEKMSNPPKSAEDLTDPKTYPEVVWPESIDAAKKASIQAYCQEIRDGGRAGIQAKQKLMEPDNEFPALFGMVEQLRLLDYRNDNDTMTGFEFNKLLEEILFEINVRFASAQIGEQISLKKAEWNNRTVKAWIAFLAKCPDADTFKKDRTARKAKAAAKDK
jgi:hypothetical protein